MRREDGPVTDAARLELPDRFGHHAGRGCGPAPPPDAVLVVHGGAGPRRTDGDERSDAELRGALKLAIAAGWQRLGAGAEAACVAAVCVLEDCPLFNAGIGSALAADAGVWCDATLMSADGYAGAVAGVQGIRHPILAAQALAHADGGPLLWFGRSAELAALHDLELVDPELMVTERQRRRLAAHRARQGVHPSPAAGDGDRAGTVGAVCLDATGRLAAATSTGGFCGKAPARVGDSAIFGAGTWAHPLTCAVSATGDGEPFLRVLFAHQIHTRMLYADQDLATAACAALATVRDAGGRGGAICVDAHGIIAAPINSDIMYRASRRTGQRTYTALGGQTGR
jgi:isoaspartyl peptidase/L-asparaginase-like protein (Ntn-hydrolase superfamily)